MGSEPSFDRLLQDKFLLTYGATGTNFFLKCVLTGDSPELCDLNQPEKILNCIQVFWRQDLN